MIKFLFWVIFAVTINLIAWQPSFADDPHYTPPVVTTDPGVVTTTGTTQVNQLTSSDGNYGMMALAASGLVFDWGVPEALQWSVAGAFVEGGDQSLSFGLGTRVGGVLFTGRLTTILELDDDDPSDLAFIVSGSGRF